MLDVSRLNALAAAIADGEAADLDEAGLDPSQRETVAKLRAIASIRHVFSSLSSDGVASARQRLVLACGDTWGPFRILGHVGRGRFGDVYRAWDPTLDREVALKLIETPDGATSEVVDEGRLMARVQHPNVVAIYGAQRLGATTGLWMQFVRGHTLAFEREQRGTFDAPALAEVGRALCQALTAVHEAGLVHRDVKPQNVLRDDRGRILLGDFGTGRDLHGDSSAAGALAGTPIYVAPELFAGGAPSPQSDIYSLGVVLFHLATGDYPVSGRSLTALRDAHTRGQRSHLRTARPDLPPSLVAAVNRALDPDPARRFDDAAAMAAALTSSSQSRRGSWRGRVAAAALVLTTTLAVASVVRQSPVPPGSFAAREWVLVTPFENFSGNAALDGTLEHVFMREVNSSTYVNIVPSGRVRDTLELMRQPVDTRLTPTLAREVAQRDGQIRLVLAGRLDRLGSRYLLSVRAEHPLDGAAVAELSEEARGDDDLLRAVRRLAAEFRIALGEALPTVSRTTSGLMRATTPSLRALQLFSAGVDRLDNESVAFDPRLAEHFLRQALAEDPSFANAHAYLAVALDGRGAADEAVAEAGRALALASDAADHERWTIASRAYSVLSRRGDPSDRRGFVERWAHALESHVALYPDDSDALRGLARAHRELGRLDAARDWQLRLAEARPTSVRAQIMGARAHVERGDVNEARALVERARALNLPLERLTPGEAAWLLTFRAQAAWLQGDPMQAAQEVERVVAAMPTMPSVVQAQVEFAAVSLLLTLGQLDRAERLLLASEVKDDHDFRVALVLASRGDLARLRRHLFERFPTPDAARRVGSLWVDVGALPVARQVVANAPHNAMYAGQLALAEGRPAEAVAHLAPEARRLQQMIGGPGAWRAVRKLAEALRELGRRDEAIIELERAYQRRWLSEGGPSGGYEWLRLADTLAALYAEAGRRADAETVEAELRTLLSVADDDHPIKRRLTESR
jgi:tetratricopeptide (TPR) repeat protein